MTSPAPRRLGLTTALLLVMGSMIGTGVFTTSGFLLRDIGSPGAVLLVWLLGGIVAACGALAYAELVTALPENGGEYQLLGRIYHPGIGFVAGWTSFVVGFSAPTAASAIAFGEYLAVALGSTAISPVVAALVLIAASSVVHAAHVGGGSFVQNVFAAGKVLLVAVFVAWGLGAARLTGFETLSAGVGDAVRSPAFAVGVVYVSYSYSGWNTAAYVAGEVRAIERTLPLALALGTALVTALYLAINVALLAAAPSEALAAAEERVSAVAATHLFGAGGGRLLSALIAFGLVSSVGALVMTGPRVCEAMGRDHPRLALLARRLPGGGPFAAIILQSALASVMALTATFDALLAFVGLALSVSAALTVAGVAVLRWREPELARPYRTWGYPATPLLFLFVTTSSVLYTTAERPLAAGGALATVGLGLVLYAWLGAATTGPRGRAASTRASS